jgi:hypothetical protein
VKALNPQSRFNLANQGEERRYTRNRAADRARGVETQRETLVRKGTAALTARMATFIVERTAEGGGCTEHDLRRAGFLEEDLKHMPAAIRLAAKKAPGLQGGA